MSAGFLAYVSAAEASDTFAYMLRLAFNKGDTATHILQLTKQTHKGKCDIWVYTYIILHHYEDVKRTSRKKQFALPYTYAEEGGICGYSSKLIDEGFGLSV